MIEYIQNLNDSEAIYLFFKSRESGSSSNMIWDGVPYLCSKKRKTAAFSKFGVIFGEEKSTVTLS